MVFERKDIAREMVSNCNVALQVVVDVSTIYRYHAKNASPVKWLCCDLPSSTDQRARGTFVQTFSVQSKVLLGEH